MARSCISVRSSAATSTQDNHLSLAAKSPHSGTIVEARPGNKARSIALSGGLVPAFYFRHDFLDRGAIEPAVAVACVVARAEPVKAKETSEPVQSHFALQDREDMPFEILVAQLVDRD